MLNVCAAHAVFVAYSSEGRFFQSVIDQLTIILSVIQRNVHRNKADLVAFSFAENSCSELLVVMCLIAHSRR